MGLRYSQGKYGAFRYGVSEAGFQFKVQISDAAGNLKAILNNELVSLSWSFKRIGGCDRFQMVLKRQFGNFTNLTAVHLQELYDVQIYITSAFAGSSTLYWRGYITSIRPNLEDPLETTLVEGVGYGQRLKEVLVNDGTGAPKEYTSTTLSGIVNSIINDYVTPNTPITAGTVDTYSTAVTSMKFDDSVWDALTKIAEITGAEFGVNKSRQVYFRTPSTTVGWRFQRKKDIGKIEDELDYTDMVNRVYIEGGHILGVPFRYVKTDLAHKGLYGLKEEKIFNSSVIDNTVADVLANSFLQNRRNYVRNIRIQLPFNKELIENADPLPLVVIVDDPKQRVYKYGTFKYGAQKYSGETKHKIDNIYYELRDVSLFTEMELNEPKPDFVDKFTELSFDLEQQRQAEGV